MISDVEGLIGKYRNVGVLVDTNILLLHVVGSTNKQRITQFKRTRERFTIEDFDLLQRILCLFSKVTTTQSILTEVSNLTGQLTEPEKSRCRTLFAEEIKRFEEIYAPSSRICDEQMFPKFGLTDCGIMATNQQYLVLTDDLPLAAYLSRQGVDTINFNNIRQYGWTSAQGNSQTS